VESSLKISRIFYLKNLLTKQFPELSFSTSLPTYFAIIHNKGHFWVKASLRRRHTQWLGELGHRLCWTTRMSAQIFRCCVFLRRPFWRGRLISICFFGKYKLFVSKSYRILPVACDHEHPSKTGVYHRRFERVLLPKIRLIKKLTPAHVSTI